jgi:hypothetical protein
VRLAAFVVAPLLFGATREPAAPGSPTVERVLPRGGQRGAETTVTLHGDRLADAAEILFLEPGIEVLSLEAPDEKQAVARLRIAADCPLGEHRLRLRTRTGISELRTFWVGPFPIVDEQEPDDFEHPQPIALDVTVHGTVTNEDVDGFVVEAKQGDRLTAEVEGMRLADAPWDPYVAILDERRFELVSCDDSSLFLQDPVASCVVPADGRYVVLIRDASLGGNDRCRYRLHVGLFPRPLVACPAGARPGAETRLLLLGDPKGPIEWTGTIPGDGGAEPAVVPVQDGRSAPSGVKVKLHAMPSAAEQEPNDSIAQATPPPNADGSPAPSALAPPIAIDGVIAAPGDVDFVRFHAKKDERFHVRLNARSVRSPLDPVLSVHDAGGKQLEANDDSIGLDSYFQFTAPADGDFFVRVADHLGAGGPLFVWRMLIAAVGPGLNLDVPRFGRDPQARQFACVPRGGRYAMAVHAGRGAFAGDVALTASGLPDGVTATAANVARNLDTTILLLEAAPDAPLAGKLVDLQGECADPPVKGKLRQKVDLVVAPPNDTDYYSTSLDRLAVAVTEEAPFALEVAPPRTPIVQNGAGALTVTAKRREGFDAPIVVRMVWLPAGVGAQPTLTIEKGKSELVYPLNSGGEAAPGTYSLALLGEAESGRGVVLASSALVPVTIAPPFVSVKLDLAAIEQGKSGPLVAHVETRTPFEGKAKIALRGLPPKCAAPDLELAASDTTVVFDVTTAADTPAGKHTSLFCEVLVPQGDATIVHYVGGGATLRVDAPAPAPAVAAAPPKEPEKPAEPKKKPLSRLEQLRQQAQPPAPAPATPPSTPPSGGQR